MFHSSYPAFQAESLTLCCADPLLYTHTYSLQEKGFIGKDGAHQGLRTGNWCLIIQFRHFCWMSGVGSKFHWNCIPSKQANRMKLKKFILHTYGKKICCKDEKVKIRFLLWITYRRPLLKVFILKIAPCIMVSLITKCRGSLKVLDSLGQNDNLWIPSLIILLLIFD